MKEAKASIDASRIAEAKSKLARLADGKVSGVDFLLGMVTMAMPIGKQMSDQDTHQIVQILVGKGFDRPAAMQVIELCIEVNDAARRLSGH